MINFWSKLTDMSAKKEPLDTGVCEEPIAGGVAKR